jgi:hypothetical protein
MAAPSLSCPAELAADDTPHIDVVVHALIDHARKRSIVFLSTPFDETCVDFLDQLGVAAFKARVTAVHGWDPGRPGPVVAKVEFTSGDIGLYEAVWQGPGPWSVTATTPECRWEMRPLERACRQERGQRRLVEVPGHEWDTRFKPGFRLQAEHAVAAVRGEPSLCPTLGDALETMRRIRLIYSC